MTTLDLDAIRKRVDATSPGEWLAISDNGRKNGIAVLGERTKRGTGLAIAVFAGADVPQRHADAAFCAHARTDVPALVAEVERLRAELAATEVAPRVTFTDRGFKHMDPIPSEYGGQIHVIESSAAIGPHIWLTASAPANLNQPEGPAVDARLHLTLANAALLRDQLSFLVDNHYQREASA
jgi:hypothetical protein